MFSPELQPGTFEVRAVCPKHQEQPMVRCHSLLFCLTHDCGYAAPACHNRFGSKTCAREVGHGGAHVSPSGASWSPQ